MRSVASTILAGMAFILAMPAGAWQFVTEDFPPFTYPATHSAPGSADAAGAGPMAEVVQAVCARLARPCSITVYPWRRALALAEAGQVDGIFTVIRSPQREQAFHVSRMLVTSHYGLYGLNGSAFVYHQPTDLAGRTLGVYGPSGTSIVLREQVRDVPDVHLQLVADNRRLLQMLAAGRFGADGLAAVNQDVAWHLIDELQLDNLREVGVLATVSYGIGLSRKRVGQAEFQRFADALAAAMADGSVAAILRRYQLEPAD